MQNTSHAVMAQRSESRDSLDDFPTPPWATRALVEHFVAKNRSLVQKSVLEPACGRGHMAQALAEYFGHVRASDVYPYGYGDVSDYLKNIYATDSYDWVITNPPFKNAEEFIHRSLQIAREGVAVLVRTVFIESVGRFERVFSLNPPSIFAQFSERVPMVKGRVDKKASTATGYAWVIWEKGSSTAPRLAWVPPCRKSLEKRDDYEPRFLRAQSQESNESPRQKDLFG